MVDLNVPPAGPVAWTVWSKSSVPGCDIGVDVTAQTAFEAHRKACVLLTSSPPFGSCVVERVGGGK